ncbi:type IV secretory system conjugative DNA transfer family protein [Microcoleus sp. B7-D4]|uniref:type IV secretory system conjugative DNA transfer family protein n=1 Tax=Microcoleus sp. B7-D4 TaxID=2818696 RepID=UPI002FD6556B
MSDFLPEKKQDWTPFSPIGGKAPSPSQTSHGSAGWLSKEMAKAVGLNDGGAGKAGLIFARGQNGLMWYPAHKIEGWGIGEGHAICCAPSRSGKGVSFVIPNLLTWPGSLICIDPKGENAFFTARRRASFGAVYILDPCGVTKEKSHTFNPLDWLRSSSNYDEDLRLIVEALTPETSSIDQFWNQGARDLILGLIHFVIATQGERKSLGRIYELLNSDFVTWEKTIKAMKHCNGGSSLLNEQVRNAANWYESLEEGHQKYHRGTALFHLGWLAPQRVRQAVETSSFDMREIKEDTASIYLCIPPLSLGLYGGFSRVVATLAIKAVMAKRAKRTDTPTLFMLDEFATTIGQMRAFEESFTVIAGYGGRFAMILQTVDQLQSLYPERRGTQSWKTIMENAGLKVFFNAREGTAEYVSKRMGVTTVNQISAIGGSKQIQRPLMFPEEVMFPKDPNGNFVPDAVYAFIEGLPTVRARRVFSYRDAEFTRLHDPNKEEPDFIESFESEWEKAEKYTSAGVPMDKLWKPPTNPPKVSQKDIEAQQKISGWDTWS